MADAKALVRDSLVIDACQFAEGTFPGVADPADAIVFTASGSGFHEAACEIGRIHERARVVRDASELDAEDTGVVLAFQDPAPIENRLENVRVFYELGVRVVQLTYNKANYIGAGCAESNDRGLTDFGREVVRTMNRLGMVVDLSHCGRKTASDAIELSEQPVVFSHACTYALAENPRNRTDDELRALAERGGVIGLTPWGPICWKKDKDEPPSLDDYLDHVEHAASVAGVDHIGFGSDNTVDGSADEEGIRHQSRLYPQVVGAFDERVGTSPPLRYTRGFSSPADLPGVVEGLQRRGFDDDAVKKFLGGNFRRVFETVWRHPHA